MAVRPSVQVSLADSGEVEGVVARVVAAARGALEGGQAALTRGAEGDIKVESVIVQVGRVGFGMVKFVVMLFLSGPQSFGNSLASVFQWTPQVEESQEEGVKDVRVSWGYTDDTLGSSILQAIQGLQ